MIRESLLQLFEQHQGKVADKWQLYLEEYERLFACYRDKPVRLLEIGVQNGGSLEIWARYFPQAEILIGCDIDSACAELQFDDPRIKVFIGDVNDNETQARIAAASTQFDIIIDDGSHRSGDITRSFALLFPSLAAGGSYVIEDLHCSYWDVYEGGLFHPFSSIAFLKLLADILNHNHWGIEQDIVSILDGFNAVYGIEFDEESLRMIHSIEFTDSVCTIRKFDTPARGKNPLGRRMVSGNEASVFPAEDLDCRRARQSVVPSQKGNHWSNGTCTSVADLLPTLHAMHEQKQWIAKLIETIDKRDDRIENLLQIIDKRDRELDQLRQSLSWRLTTPLRALQKPEHSERVRVLPPESPQQPDATALLPDSLKHSNRAQDAFIRSTRPIIEQLQSTQPDDYKRPDFEKPSNTDLNDYGEWLKRYDTLWETDRIRIRHSIDDMGCRPLLSVLVLADDVDIEWLKRSVDSVQNQLYEHWELCIAVAGSACESEKKYLAALTSDHAQTKVVLNQADTTLAVAWNRALESCSGDWVVLIRQDDILPQHALFHIARTINDCPGACLIYTDDDMIDDRGIRSEPYFKCEWNKDLFYFQDFISCPGAYRRELLTETGGFRTGLKGALTYDLALRYVEQIDSRNVYHIPMVLCHRRKTSERSAPGAKSQLNSGAARQKALQDHVDRTGANAIIEHTSEGFRVRYALPDTSPLVSLVIPTKNRLSLLKTCIDSIETKTTYPNYEIMVVDNGSDDPATIDYINSLRSVPNIRVLHDARPFNYAELNNSAVEEAQGELIALVNNDIEVIEAGWLTEMVGIALQPGVGVVGAKLLYPDDTIQHAGVILGIGGVAGHAFKRAPADSPGYFGRAMQVQSLSAVTGACQVIRKSVFLEVGGLDSQNLAIAFNDIDFCLRVRESGYRIVYTPHALLYHHESASRGYEDTPEKKIRFGREVQVMKNRWGDKLITDPAYNPNLSLDNQDFTLAWPPRIDKRFLP